MFQGNNDSIALPERAEKTYEQIQSPPKILINVSGVNHYGITNTNNPDGARPDANMGAIAQDVAVETVARWSGLFLRAITKMLLIIFIPKVMNWIKTSASLANHPINVLNCL